MKLSPSDFGNTLQLPTDQAQVVQGALFHWLGAVGPQEELDSADNQLRIVAAILDPQLEIFVVNRLASETITRLGERLGAYATYLDGVEMHLDVVAELLESEAGYPSFQSVRHTAEKARTMGFDLQAEGILIESPIPKYVHDMFPE